MCPQSFCWVWCKKYNSLCMNLSALVHSCLCQFRLFWFRNQKKLLVQGTFVPVLCVTVWRTKYWRKNIQPSMKQWNLSDVGHRLLGSSDTFENMTLHPNKVKEQPIFGVSGLLVVLLKATSHKLPPSVSNSITEKSGDGPNQTVCFSLRVEKNYAMYIIYYEATLFVMN